MTIKTRVLRLLFAAPFLVLVVSCVQSPHPLSDEKNSTIDERLLGEWHIEDDEGIWEVKKSGDTKDALEVLVPGIDGSSRAVAFTTIIKSKCYVSITDIPEKSPEKPQAFRYDICQYVVLDHDTVEVRGMEEKVIKKAIADKKLGGDITDEDTPIITESPDGIIRYLEANADECFAEKTDYLIVFKRQTP